MSSELLWATTEEKEAQAELLGKNVSAFEKLIQSKEEQLQSLNDRLQARRVRRKERGEHTERHRRRVQRERWGERCEVAGCLTHCRPCIPTPYNENGNGAGAPAATLLYEQVYRDTADKREDYVLELQEQLQSRAAQVADLISSKTQLLRELTAAQEEARQSAQSAGEAKARWFDLEKTSAAAQRELERLNKKLMVKEVHVAQLANENKVQTEGAHAMQVQLRALLENLETPEGMLREMLRMTEMELLLKNQLAAEKEAKLSKQVSTVTRCKTVTWLPICQV